MGARMISRVILVCDGCAAEFFDPEAQSAIETRFAAYNAGWRYPEQVTKSGRPARTTSDACPACKDGWTTQVQGSRSGYRLQDGTDRVQTKPDPPERPVGYPAVR
jgi:hypothetical protein